MYDGYGRLVSQTTPEAGTRAYTYYINDWVNTVRNDRIVTGNTYHTATFTYNSRGLVTGISYNDGSTPSASFGYDEYGARTSMNDGAGSTTYAYDQYHRLQTETRSFNGLNIGTIQIGYEWNLAGGLNGGYYTAGAGQRKSTTGGTTPARRRGRHGPDQWGLLKQRDERRQPDRLPELRRGQERPLR